MEGDVKTTVKFADLELDRLRNETPPAPAAAPRSVAQPCLWRELPVLLFVAFADFLLGYNVGQWVLLYFRAR
jgi:hypothetical protein